MAAAIQQQADRAALSELSFSVLGVRVDVVQIPEVVARMEDWIARRERCRYIAVTGMHGVTEAQHDSEFKTILNSAGLVVPDGMPLVWIGRRHRFDMPRRVYGPELFATFCEQTASKGYRHFFYGGAPGVAEDLASQFWLGSVPRSISTLGVSHRRRRGWAIMAWNGYFGSRSSRDACGAATWFMERNSRRLFC